MASIGILSLSLAPVAFAEEAVGVKTPPATETVSPASPSIPAATPPASDAAPAQTGAADDKSKALQEKVKANVPAAAPQAKGDKTSAQNAFVNSFTNGFGSGSTAAAPKTKVQAKPQAKPQAKAVSPTYDPYAAYRRGYGTTRTYSSSGFANNSAFQTGNNARPGVLPRMGAIRPYSALTGSPTGLGQQIMRHQQEQRQELDRIGSQYRK